MAIDLLSQFNTLAQNLMGQSDQMKSNFTGIAAQKKAAGEALVDDVARGPIDREGNTVISKQVEEAGKLETQNRKDEFWHSMHMDGDVSGRLSTQMADAFYANAQEAATLANDVKQRESIGLFDNPIAYLWNQIMLPDARNARDAAQSRADLAAKTLQTANAMLQQTALSEKEYSKTTNQAAIESKLDAAKASLDAQVQRAKIESLTSQAQDVKMIFDADQVKLNILGSVMQARNSEEHLALARAAEGRAQAEFAERMDAKKDKKVSEQNLVDWIKTGITETGGNAATFNPNNVLSYIKSGQPLPKELNDLAEIGFRKQTYGVSGLSTDTSVAIQRAQTFGITPPTATASVINQSSAAVEAWKNAHPSAKPEELKKAFNETVTATLKQHAALIKPNDASNPYSAPSIVTMAEQSKEFRNSALYQNVLKPQIEVGKLDTNDPSVITKLGLAALEQGKISLNELIGGTAVYYQQGVMAASLNNQLRRFGMKESTSYVADVDSMYKDKTSKFHLFGQSQVRLNLADPTVVREFYTKQLVAKAMIDRAEYGTPVATFDMGVK